MNKLQWNFNGNSYIFIQGSAFKNVVWKIASILSRSHCVKKTSVCTVLPRLSSIQTATNKLRSIRPGSNCDTASNWLPRITPQGPISEILLKWNLINPGLFYTEPASNLLMIFSHILCPWMLVGLIWFKSYWNLFPVIQLTPRQHCFN